MGNRLSKIYTRTGDDGTTGLGDGSRVDKDHQRIEAIGSIDELNSLIGQLLVHDLPDPVKSCLTTIQHWLFDIGGELCLPGHKVITAEQVAFLESVLDEMNSELAPLKEFILPGGCPAAAACHHARTVCRRAERRLYTLGNSEPVNKVTLQFLNRLSDLLFVMARHLNKVAGVADVCWQQKRK
ncbi:MAG: cob(I)yrinic acid a,c-diamide adenosyltransferase [Gammaproteobacteria bacterium]|nr:MAG: cob(I)yrinic acid a,c-diamide adenosyltransferase [Gammaproteobacteria bacterium]